MDGHCCTPSLTLAQKLAPVKFEHSCCREHLRRTGDQVGVDYFKTGDKSVDFLVREDPQKILCLHLFLHPCSEA